MLPRECAQVDRHGAHPAAGRTENPSQPPSARHLQHSAKSGAIKSEPSARPGSRPSTSAPTEGATTHAHRSEPTQAKNTARKLPGPAVESSQTCTSQPGRIQAESADAAMHGNRTERKATDAEHRYMKSKHVSLEHAQLNSGGSTASEGCHTPNPVGQVKVEKLTFPVDANTPSVYGKRQRTDTLQRSHSNLGSASKTMKQEGHRQDTSAAPTQPHTPDSLPAASSRAKPAA